MERAFGRVDELDDPRPGHLSDGPTPISSTTTITATLQDRFVKGEDQEQPEVPNDEDKKESEANVENTEEQHADEKVREEKTEGEDHEAGPKEDKVTCSEGGEDKENQA